METAETWSFFFQAEDGIRDIGVTGVQTCALPICAPLGGTRGGARLGRAPGHGGRRRAPLEYRFVPRPRVIGPIQIGRASCRERVQISVVAVSLKKNTVPLGRRRVLPQYHSLCSDH